MRRWAETRRASTTRSLRSRLSWSATAVVALWVALLTVGANVLLTGALSRQADGLLRVRAEAVAATVESSGGGGVRVRDVRGDGALDVGTWVFTSNGRTIESPPGSSSAADRRAAGLAAGSDAVRSADTELPGSVRLLAMPVYDNGTRVASVVTSTSLTPYHQLRRLAGISSAVLAVVLLVVVHLVLRGNVSRALRPVREMTAQAGRWSAHDVGRRFGDVPRPVELADLAHTLDGLLDRLGAVLRHERQLSDELSHELRTPLARVQAEVDLLRQRPRARAEQLRALAVVNDAAGSMRQILDTLMAAARSNSGAAPGRCRPAQVLEPALRRAAAGRPELALDVDVPADLVAGVDAALLERMLVPVLDNAVRYARSSVVITGRAGTGHVDITVSDDGPGIAEKDRERVFEPGWRADAADGHDGAGLGLALVRRLADATGSRVRASPDLAGGSVEVQLPTG